jgi:acetyltransferase-like isoleucine patch superfamily enzyme
VAHRVLVLTLRILQAWDRLRLAIRAVRHPGLQIHPEASSNFAAARFDLAPGARLRIGRGSVTERLAGRLHFSLGPGADVEIGERVWLRTEVGEVHVIAFEGARIRLGDEAFLNGCHVSAKQSVVFGRRAWLGTGSRLFDSDQHDFDDDRPERSEPVVLGDHCWVASDVTVLRGVEIGAHSVVGTRSLVTHSIPPHTLAYGVPARPHGPVGDRSKTR